MEEKNIPIIIQSLEKHLAERIEKLWRVFSWTSTLLITITGGMIVYVRKEEIKFDNMEFILISAVVLITTIYALLWINENLKLETKIRNQLNQVFENDIGYPEIKDIRPDKAFFGYKIVILLLGIIALIATMINYN